MIKFYRCRHCGNIIIKLHDSKVPVVCCNEEMEILKANTVDAAQEKHIPVVTSTKDGIEVVVGSTLHPMTEEHYIEWIYVETQNGGHIEYLQPGKTPKVSISLAETDVKAVYAYCNLHGLWQAK